MTENKEEKFYPSKMRPLVKGIVSLLRNNRSLIEIGNEHLLLATVAANIEGFDNKKKCINCDASMAMQIIRLDISDAILLFAMAKEVRSRQIDGIPFTEANKIHVSNNPNISHTCQCRTSKNTKLGLLAKNGDGTWSITTRGWAALRGEEVPASRVTFRKKIIERPDDVITLSEAFREHQETMENRQRRGKSLKLDRRNEFKDYRPEMFFEVAGYAQPNLI